MFLVDGKKMDLDSIIMMLQMQRTDNLDQQIKDQMDNINNLNEKLQECDSVMNELRQCKQEKKESPSMKVQDFFVSNGISLPSGKYTDKEWDSAIGNLKSYVDSISSKNEQDMIRLQSLMNKRSQALQMASNLLQKMSNAKNSIANIR